jgi:SAM-dependent methyltransferase
VRGRGPTDETHSQRAAARGRPAPVSALSFMQRLPAVAPLAGRLDGRRAGRVEALLSARRAQVRDARQACDAMLERGADDAARASLDAVAAALLGELRGDERGDGALRRGATRLDAAVRSDGAELLDVGFVPQRVKDFTMRLLHRTNVLAGSYEVWTGAVAAALGDRDDAHVYELAAGTGGYARHLARRQPPGRRVRVTSSDLSPAYVSIGAEAARAEGVSDVTWEVCDALDLRRLRDRGDVDLFLCTQAAHHLSAGQLVQMISQAIHAAPEGLLVIDLLRSATTALGTLALTAVVAPWPVLMYDGFQSVRRAYTPAELSLLARLAGAGRVDARPYGPAWCLLHARR